MSLKFPLLVQFEFHPDSKEAAAAADYLHAVLNADPAVPGLQIPTTFTPDDGSSEPPKPAVANEADRVLVVLLADDHLAVAARKPTKSGTTWGDYATKLRALTEAAGHRFMPVQLTESAYPIDKRLDDTNFLRAWAIDGAEERHKFIARRLVHLLIRRLRPRPGNEDAPPVTIFLSHTKMDLEHEPRVVKTLLAHLTATQPEKTWFDSGDISTGSRFAHEIEKGVKDTALLTIVTDSYSSRAWCRKEVLFAKHHQRPVVIVDGVQERETRRFPYSGNTPVIRWKAHDAQGVVDLLLREVLRHAYAEESLKQRKREGDVVLPAGPELVTIVHLRKDKDKDQPVVLYPDPPLGPEELEVLERTGVRVETPLQRHALAHDLRSRNLMVALSVSGAEDLSRYGLRTAHLDSILLDLSRYLLVAGVRLAYGGHLGPDGYTLRLADLLRDPIVEQLRGTPSTEQAAPELVTWLPWPMLVSVRDEARLGPLVDMQRCTRPSDIDESLDPAFVAKPDVAVPFDTPVRRFAWSRGLTEMRERQTTELGARVVVGGKLGRPDNLYLGRMPGVLEEALFGIRAQRPVYLVGAFGGCARLVLDALDGIERAELTSAYHQALPHAPELKKLYADRGVTWEEYESIAAELKACGMSGLKNGLSVEENRELATARSAERIVELVLHGLQQCNQPAVAGGAE
ncbi:TIR domain-containing protein [Myxococcus llanfairpwllgwyngyllgogerychwyrndrobwllllantysiliogogogochensis]|uniref:TIR domain-containing protein n=1 Tax=Myxococcus llanfairpwllgwyngyllgogerychwyrndrobwllllantysiliogogogochensis TaxID=2590453 RepID=A0A540WK25_9BACT|nr:TIR domain-containing protein [Myxococcus llanfairpwllgwyngyllgogerychwyrndrobwllllantysiliogogogochensis]TQF09379.1 TIR domain-containing protein [Myxococcus llanfairpwllgwyngyllgogerychwyrndrobwllllantysiliogogogochensis]